MSYHISVLMSLNWTVFAASILDIFPSFCLKEWSLLTVELPESLGTSQ